MGCHMFDWYFFVMEFIFDVKQLQCLYKLIACLIPREDPDVVSVMLSFCSRHDENGILIYFVLWRVKVFCRTAEERISN